MTTEKLLVFQHGTLYAYRQGCHCDACRAAVRAKARRERKQHGGICQDCGQPTSSRSGVPFARCRRCNTNQLGSNQTTILKHLQSGPKTISELRDYVGYQFSGKVLNRLIRLELIERIDKGLYRLSQGENNGG